ncbi:hypothetical protein J437_LFUL017776 [Ladona fulva]|uniref:Uncharacterized protein n=1 Tax=Ladona fulva TaxID=123851 RepID=A0A8K0KAQ0_LADFU|nr:hypothetical protein J437_LFUL017776 [Ladona fulva]
MCGRWCSRVPGATSLLVVSMILLLTASVDCGFIRKGNAGEREVAFTFSQKKSTPEKGKDPGVDTRKVKVVRAKRDMHALERERRVIKPESQALNVYFLRHATTDAAVSTTPDPTFWLLSSADATSVASYECGPHTESYSISQPSVEPFLYRAYVLGKGNAITAGRCTSARAVAGGDTASGEMGIVKTCHSSTPCGWAVYLAHNRREVYFVQNTCECEKDKECLRAEDDLSVSAYIYRCRGDSKSNHSMQ